MIGGRADLLDPVQRRGAFDGADPLAGQVARLRDRRVTRRQDPLVCHQVHRREVDQLLAFTRDAHGLDDHVDLVVLQRGNAIGRRQDAVLDLRRGAEDVARHLACDIDVESGDLAGDRIAEAEQVAADVETDDQPSAGLDVGDGGVGLRPVRERPQARGEVAVVVGVLRRRHQLRRAVPPCQPGQAARAKGSAPV